MINFINKVLGFFIYVALGFIILWFSAGLIFSSGLILIFPWFWYLFGIRIALLILIIGVVTFSLIFVLGYHIYKKLKKELHGIW